MEVVLIADVFDVAGVHAVHELCSHTAEMTYRKTSPVWISRSIGALGAKGDRTHSF